MPDDTLASLLRLRQHQVNLAQRDLADRQAAAAQAQDALTAIATRLRAEMDGPATPGLGIGAWLARSARDGAAAAQRAALAEQAVAAARETLFEHRARQKLAEIMQARRAAEARRQALRKEQITLSDLALRPRKSVIT